STDPSGFLKSLHPAVLSGKNPYANLSLLEEGPGGGYPLPPEIVKKNLMSRKLMAQTFDLNAINPLFPNFKKREVSS
ncbi:MAG TPA: hypothetical protein VE134_10240, partial [Methanomicrobiales archaeon]|nr:hypothetical protein [Methanomicrobiales archaeon]